MCRWSLYIHQNKINGKCYVGITSQEPEKRWMNGCAYSEKLPFGRAVRKYGWDNFTHVAANIPITASTYLMKRGQKLRPD